MTHAYNELYLNDAKECLSDMIDYAVNDCGIDADWFASLFVTTGYAQKFETGNPSVISGMSGVELARAIMKTFRSRNTGREHLPNIGQDGLSQSINGAKDEDLRTYSREYRYHTSFRCTMCIMRWIYHHL